MRVQNAKSAERQATSAPLGSVHTLVLLPVWGNATHESGWTHGTHCGVRSSLSEGLPCSQALTGGGVHLVQNAEQFIGRTSTPLSRFDIDIMQVIFELHVTHPTLQCSKDEQDPDQDRLPFCKWIRISHRRGSHMGRNSPMLRQAQVRCCIAGSERPWRRA